jgi:hypothetical protein
MDWSLKETQACHRLIPKSLIDAFDELRHGILHFERFDGIDFQQKDRGAVYT